MNVMVEELRKNRTGATVIFTQFTRLKDKFDNSIFCCFEGDDAKYYYKRIEDKTGYPPENIIPLNCSGKTEVLRFYKLVKDKEEYSGIRLLYFIDRDFDMPNTIGTLDVYETPCYSVENFYTTREAFIRILKCEFNYTEIDSEFQQLLDIFIQRQAQFHEQSTMFNAWLACQRDKSTLNKTARLFVNDFNIVKIIPIINLETVESNYDIVSLEKYFPLANRITEEEITNKINDFSFRSPQEVYRGKFEIDFLFALCQSLLEEFLKPDGKFKRKKGVQLNHSKKNMISEFSQYASTTMCLSEYLTKFAAN